MSEDQNEFQVFLRGQRSVSGATEQASPLDIPLSDLGELYERKLRPPAGMNAELPSDPIFGTLLDWAFRDLHFDPSIVRRVPHDGKPAQADLTLFNVIVALEWAPDQPYLDKLHSAFDQACDLLYDVTDGYMAIGQVVVGGRELMDFADIQIFASNRFYPRTAVNGLTDLGKYQPIRLGRGLWDKQARQTIDWDQSDNPQKQNGPGTIVHEWGHYALGMKDRYFRLDDDKFVVPALSPVENSIMADVDVTELSGSAEHLGSLLATRRPEDANGEDASDWDMLKKHPVFGDRIDPDHTPDNRNEPLVIKPAFHAVGAAQLNQSPLRLDWESVVAQYPMKFEHCWIYVVKGDRITEPRALIAQGTFEKSPDTFQLLGAEPQDFVVLFGNTGDGAAFQPLVLFAKIEHDKRPWVWKNATPARPEQRDGAAVFPLVDVSVIGRKPLAIDEAGITLPRYTIRVDGFDANWRAVTFPIGLDRIESRQEIPDLTALEGHVMLISNTEPTQLLIASYSVGGSPSDSGFPGHPNPLPAGSAEGNAMLFFYDSTRGPIDATTQYANQAPGVLAKHYEQFKIVTVTNPINDAPPPGDWIPCSYAFSVTSNTSFKTLVAGAMLNEAVATIDLKPTLVLYYDNKSRDDPSVDLTIGRYNAKSRNWDLIYASGTKHRPRKGFLIALSLNDRTAPGLFAEQPQAEHYRLFRKDAAMANGSAQAHVTGEFGT